MQYNICHSGISYALIYYHKLLKINFIEIVGIKLLTSSKMKNEDLTIIYGAVPEIFLKKRFEKSLIIHKPIDLSNGRYGFVSDKTSSLLLCGV